MRLILKLCFSVGFVFFYSSLTFSQVNYDAGRNLKEWTTTGDYLVYSHEWFGDTLILSSTFRYVFDTIERTQGDSTITVVRYGSAQGIHIYPDENLPATVNIVDTAFIPVSTPVRYNGKMYWGGQKSFTPPDTSSWIVLYEFDPRTLEYRTLTLHEADEGFHYFHDLEVDEGLLSAITRAGTAGSQRYYLNIIDPTEWELIAHASLEWTTGNLSPNSERLFTSDIQILHGDTTVIFSGKEDADNSVDVLFFKFYDLDGNELDTKYSGDVINNSLWYDTRRNYDRSILTERKNSDLVFLSNHYHYNHVEDSTSPVDFKVYTIDPITYTHLDSSDMMGDPRFYEVMQAMMDYTTIGDTLIAVGQCEVTYVEDSTYAVMGGNPMRYQLGVLAYDMNTLELLWTKRIIAETEYRELSDDYGVTSSPHNFVSATAMTWHRNEFDGTLDNEVRIIHLNEHGCPSADPDRTCDELIWLDQYVSNTDDPASSSGVVSSLEVIPSLITVGSTSTIRFLSEKLSSDSFEECNLQLFSVSGQQIETSTLQGPDYGFGIPSNLKAGIYFAYLKTLGGESIGVGRFVVQ